MHTSEDAVKSGFSSVKPLCCSILEQRHDVKQLAASLAQLERVLAASNTDVVSKLGDYILLPLLRVLESTERTRGRKRPTPGKTLCCPGTRRNTVSAGQRRERCSPLHRPKSPASCRVADCSNPIPGSEERQGCGGQPSLPPTYLPAPPA